MMGRGRTFGRARLRPFSASAALAVVVVVVATATSSVLAAGPQGVRPASTPVVRHSNAPIAVPMTGRECHSLPHSGDRIRLCQLPRVFVDNRDVNWAQTQVVGGHAYGERQEAPLFASKSATLS